MTSVFVSQADVVVNSGENLVENGITNISINVRNDQSDEDCGDCHACSDVIGIISQPKKITKNHPTYISKQHSQKKVPQRLPSQRVFHM